MKPTSSTYNVGVIRSSATDSVATWGAATTLRDTSVSVNYVFPTILPMSGGNMYSFWYADGNIEGKKYTGSWGTQESIATTTASVTTKIPSAVVDGSDNIDLAYIDSSGAVQHKQRTSSWGSTTAVDSASGNTSPTITRETGTGDLYVFYLQSTGQIKGRKYSGSWSDVTGIDTSTTAKVFITSPYSASAAWKVSWMWDQGGTSPYEVKIARIPEFEDIAVPVGIVLAFALLPRVARRRARRAHGVPA
jgi:hypothetical protein